MTMFDADSFLHMQVAEANDTKRIPVPVGEYTAIVKEVKTRSWQSKTDATKAGIALDVTWSIDDQAAKDATGRDEVTLRQGIMLDLSEAGGLDMGKGKNIGLGRLRTAVGLNTPGEPFAFTMLTGRMAKVQVSHRVDGEDIYDEVKSVAAFS